MLRMLVCGLLIVVGVSSAAQVPDPSLEKLLKLGESKKFQIEVSCTKTADGECAVGSPITFRVVPPCETCTYRWDFGDGRTLVGSTAAVQHAYQSAGQFTPSVDIIIERECPPFLACMGPSREHFRARHRIRTKLDLNYVAVRVFYATNRARTPSAEPSEVFGAARGRLVYGTALVTIPRRHKYGHVEARTLFRLEFRDHPEKHVVILKVADETHENFYASVANATRYASKKDLFVFVHGYNVAFDEAVRRTAQLAYDLAFDGAPVLFSWPSRGGMSEYPADEASVEWSTEDFIQFLTDLRQRSGAEAIHVIAHSMGNRLVVNALKDLSKSNVKRPLVRQLVLTAPDIDAGTMMRVAQFVTPMAFRTTVYVSTGDMAVGASHRFHDAARVGTSLLAVPGADTVDASAVDSTFLGHSYPVENNLALHDLAQVIVAELPVTRRRLKPIIGPHGQRLWQLRATR